MTEEIIILCDEISSEKVKEFNCGNDLFVKKISSYNLEMNENVRMMYSYSIESACISSVIDFIYDMMSDNDCIYLMLKNISYEIELNNRTHYTIDVSKAKREDTELLLMISDSKMSYDNYYVFTKSSDFILQKEKTTAEVKTADLFVLYTDSVPPKFYGKPMKDKFKNNMYGSILRKDVFGLLEIVYSCFSTSTKVSILALDGSTKRHAKDDPAEFVIDLSDEDCLGVFKKLHTREYCLESGNCISFINGKREMWDKSKVIDEISKSDVLYPGIKYVPD